MAASFKFLGGPLLLTGLVLGALGLFALLRMSAAPASGAAAPRQADEGFRFQLFVLLLIVAVGAAVRLSGLDARGIMHPEAYIPGLDLPPGISEPPPRHGLAETASWHFHFEPHPFGYYLAMWGWTKLFGASIVSIRLPEALLGAASVLLIFRVGALSYGARAGAVAAGLLALHGFHIFWSQSARMYAPGAFFGLASTLLLLEIARRERPSRWLEAGYVVSLLACALTVEFTWPLLAVQMLWTALNRRAGGVSRLAVLQACAVMLAAPMLSHALMTGRNDAAQPPSLAFLVQFFSFGFLFEHGAYSEAWAGLPPQLYPLVLAFCLVLLGLGLTQPTRETVVDRSLAASPLKPLLLAAAGGSAMMLGFAFMAYERRRGMAAASLLPWATVAVPWLIGAVRPTLARFAPALDRLVERASPMRGLAVLLALAPTALLFVVSFKLSLTAPRAFLIFVPYLLVLIAAGVERLWSRRLLAGLALASLVGVFVASDLIVGRAPASPRDYRAIAAAMTEHGRPDALVFAPNRHWAYTPLFVYLPHRRIITQDFAQSLAAAPKLQVWVPSFEDEPSAAMTQALSRYKVVDKVKALRASATLYAPRTGEP